MSKIGHSKITGKKHENLETLISFRLRMLHSDKVFFVKRIQMIDVMAGNGKPTKYSNTSSPEIFNRQFSKWRNKGKVRLRLNDIELAHIQQLENKFSSAYGLSFSCRRDSVVYREVVTMLSSSNDRSNGTYCILNVDPNNPSDLDFDGLLSMMKVHGSKEMDLILNISSTHLKRGHLKRLRDYIDAIEDCGKHTGWIRKPLKGDKSHWAMMAFFPKVFKPNGPIKGWCEIHSKEGSRVIEYYSTTNEEKKTKGQINLFTEHIKNTSDTRNSEQSEK